MDHHTLMIVQDKIFSFFLSFFVLFCHLPYLRFALVAKKEMSLISYVDVVISFNYDFILYVKLYLVILFFLFLMLMLMSNNHPLLLYSPSFNHTHTLFHSLTIYSVHFVLCLPFSFSVLPFASVFFLFNSACEHTCAQQTCVIKRPKRAANRPS